jgi:limonene-1,2-epoxide hydrolase
MADVTEATAIGVVRSFLEALEALDADAILELTDPEIVYQNVPFPPARGRAEFERQMRWFERQATGFEARVHNMAADSAVVLTERTDVLRRGKFAAEFWVCGTFEVRDGKVVLWRDRFDFADVIVACVKGAVRALLDRG